MLGGKLEKKEGLKISCMNFHLKKQANEEQIKP